MTTNLDYNNNQKTLNVIYKYTPELDKLVQEVNKHYSEVYKCDYKPLEPNTYAYDGLVHGINMILKYVKNSEDIEYLSNQVHEGWCINYKYWSEYDNKIKSESRDNCLNTKYDELSEEEKEKDRLVVRYILKTLKK